MRWLSRRMVRSSPIGPAPPAAAAGNPEGPPQTETDRGITGNGQVAATGVPVSLLAEILSHQLGRQVVDHTELKGTIDFKNAMDPDEKNQPFSRSPTASPMPSPASAPPPDSSGHLLLHCTPGTARPEVGIAKRASHRLRH